MKAWEIDELRRGVRGKWVMRGESARAFNGRICTDSRKAGSGDLFFAIKGERFDGHDFFAEVVEREVAAVVVSGQWAEGSGQWSVVSGQKEVLLRARDKGVAVIGVEDTIAGLNRLAAAYRGNELGGGFRAKVIAVGGSNGKTTTKRILHALLEEKFGVGKGGGGGTASPKSFNNNIGMPLTLLGVMPGHDYVVLEIGTNAPGEIGALAAVCRPDVAVITSIGLEHLEKLGDLAGVAREEAAVAEHVAGGGTLIVADVPELLREVALATVQKVVVGMEKEAARSKKQEGRADLMLTGVEEGVEGTSFSVNGRGNYFVPLLGEHNAMNALMAVAAARRLGVMEEQIVAGLMKVKAAEGRFEPLEVGWWRVINDAYNANPTSVEAALRTFGRMGDGGDKGTRGQGDKVTGGQRRVVILGDMLELGGASEEMHRRVGRWVAAGGFEVLVAIGPWMKFAAEEAGKMRNAECGMRKMEIAWFGDTAAACAGVGGIGGGLREGDRILLKGSHGMALERMLDTLRGVAGQSH